MRYHSLNYVHIGLIVVLVRSVGFNSVNGAGPKDCHVASFDALVSAVMLFFLQIFVIYRHRLFLAAASSTTTTQSRLTNPVLVANIV